MTLLMSPPPVLYCTVLYCTALYCTVCRCRWCGTVCGVWPVLYCTVLYYICIQGELAGGVPVLRSLQPRHHHPCYPPQVQHSHQRYNSPVTGVVNKLKFCLIHRKLKVFKYSSPTFLSLTLLGCCIMYRYDNLR